MAQSSPQNRRRSIIDSLSLATFEECATNREYSAQQTWGTKDDPIRGACWVQRPIPNSEAASIHQSQSDVNLTRSRSRTLSRKQKKKDDYGPQRKASCPPLLSILHSQSVSDLQHLMDGSDFFPSSDSPIQRSRRVYCEGPLLRAVQEARVFADCKDFVDMPMKMDPEIVLRNFRTWRQVNMASSTQSFKDISAKTRNRLIAFICEHFHPPGSDLEPVDLPDYYPEPPVLAKIKDDKLRVWAQNINRIWNTLGRRVNYDALVYPQRHSLLPSRRLLVVPGGRFREVYYWDTYWIVEGLIVSGMVKTAVGVVLNLLEMVERYGFVPNGSRCYYLDRSQPPLLSEMVKLIYTATQDAEFLERAFLALEKEYAFWMRSDGTRCVRVNTSPRTDRASSMEEFALNRYYSSESTPRPESYREDIHTVELSQAAGFGQQGQKYRDIRAGAETGWDFSSRWFADGRKMERIDTTSVIPVDLNCILYRMEVNMGDFCGILSKDDRQSYFIHQSRARGEAIEKVLWQQELAQWRDVRISEDGSVKAVSDIVSASNWLPLWSECYRDMSSTFDVVSVCKSLFSSGLLAPGGIATTSRYTTQQWDYPNAWAPLQWMLVQGLRKTHDKLAEHLAFAVSQTWVAAGYEAFIPEGEMFIAHGSSHMYEKYDSSKYGFGGGGGEYVPQTGFGWSNGVVLSLLDTYGDRLTSGILWSRVHRSAIMN